MSFFFFWNDSIPRDLTFLQWKLLNICRVKEYSCTRRLNQGQITAIHHVWFCRSGFIGIDRFSFSKFKKKNDFPFNGSFRNFHLKSILYAFFIDIKQTWPNSQHQFTNIPSTRKRKQERHGRVKSVIKWKTLMNTAESESGFMNDYVKTTAGTNKILKMPKKKVIIKTNMRSLTLDDLEVWKLRLRERPREDEPEECERSEQDGRGQFEPDGRGQLVPAWNESFNERDFFSFFNVSAIFFIFLVLL